MLNEIKPEPTSLQDAAQGVADTIDATVNNAFAYGSSAAKEVVNELGTAIGEGFIHAFSAAIKIQVACFFAYMGKTEANANYDDFKDGFHLSLEKFSKEALKENHAHQDQEDISSPSTINNDDSDKIARKINIQYLHGLWNNNKDFFSKLAKEAANAGYSDEVMAKIIKENRTKLLDIGCLAMLSLNNPNSLESWKTWAFIKIVGHKYLYTDKLDNYSPIYDIFTHDKQLGCNILMAFLKNVADQNIAPKQRFGVAFA